MRIEREVGRLLIIEQCKLLHMKAESDQVDKKLVLVVQTNKKQTGRQVDALVVFATVIRQKQVLVEMCQKDSAIFAHELNVFFARGQCGVAQVQLTQIGLIPTRLV